MWNSRAAWVAFGEDYTMYAWVFWVCLAVVWIVIWFLSGFFGISHTAAMAISTTVALVAIGVREFIATKTDTGEKDWTRPYI